MKEFKIRAVSPLPSSWITVSREMVKLGFGEEHVLNLIQDHFFKNHKSIGSYIVTDAPIQDVVWFALYEIQTIYESSAEKPRLKYYAARVFSDKMFLSQSDEAKRVFDLEDVAKILHWDGKLESLKKDLINDEWTGEAEEDDE